MAGRTTYFVKFSNRGERNFEMAAISTWQRFRLGGERLFEMEEISKWRDFDMATISTWRRFRNAEFSIW